MISDRMRQLVAGNSAIRAMFEEGLRLSALYGRENVFDFSLGNPNFPAPPAVRDAVDGVLETESARVHAYMPNAGFPDVRAAVAENLNARYGMSYGPDHLCMTVGAAGGLNVILRTLLNPGDEVLAIAPYFLEYGNYVANHGGVLRPVLSLPGSFLPDLDALAAAVNEKTRAIIVNNPNNPTGVVYGADTVAALAEMLERRQKELGTSIYLLSDEPYRELAYDGAEVPWLPAFYRNTIVGYSWSKSLSLPGERIGYLLIPSELDDYPLVWAAAGIANRMLGFVNAPSLMQLAVARCLSERTDIEAYDRNRQTLYNGLTDCGFTCVYPRGAFYIWMKSPEADEKAFVTRAKAYNLLLVPGTSFMGAGYVRLAYCVSPETIERSLPAFRKLAEEYRLTQGR
jgi:aspartate aminotransferase